MNKVLTSKDIKSRFPILSSNMPTFTLAGKTFAVRSMAFDTITEVEQYVDENPGRIVIFDQPNLVMPDVPSRDGDKVVLRFVLLPDFDSIITRLLQQTDISIVGDLKKDIDAYLGK